MAIQSSAGKSSEKPSLFAWLVGGLAATTLVVCVAMDVNRRYIVTAPDKTLRSYADWDGNLTKAAQSGGLFLHFVNFHGLGWGYTTNIYFRAVYLLYPRTVLVGDPRCAVNDAIDLQQINSDHDDTWMRNYGIAHVLTVTEADGLPVVQSLRQIAPSRSAKARPD